MDGTASLPDETPQQVGRRTFIEDVAAIADRFGVDLKLPDKLTKEDFETIYLLKQCMQNGTLELDNISFVLTKSEDNRDLLPQQFATGKISFGFVNTQHQAPLQLFGAVIDMGPVVMQGEAEVASRRLASSRNPNHSPSEAGLGGSSRV